MARILKFRIVSDTPEDDTFITTKHTVMETITEMTTETDDAGNMISFRHNDEPRSRVNIKEGVSAVGKISHKPAKVIILETDDGLTEDGFKQRASDMERKPIIKIS
jgi:hypothetical protein